MKSSLDVSLKGMQGKTILALLKVSCLKASDLDFSGNFILLYDPFLIQDINIDANGNVRKMNRNLKHCIKLLRNKFVI